MIKKIYMIKQIFKFKEEFDLKEEFLKINTPTIYLIENTIV